MQDAIELLEETLEEEKRTDKKLTGLAESEINVAAEEVGNEADEEDEDEDEDEEDDDDEDEAPSRRSSSPRKR